MVRSAIRRKLANVKAELPSGSQQLETAQKQNAGPTPLLSGTQSSSNELLNPPEQLKPKQNSYDLTKSQSNQNGLSRLDSNLTEPAKLNSNLNEPTKLESNAAELIKLGPDSSEFAKPALMANDLLPYTRLRPAEIAYLSSNGDISHTMLVLGADLIQRALKSRFPDSKVPPLAPYEVRMWGLAKETVKDWAQGRLDKHLPGDIKKDPVEYVRRVSKIYNFIVHTARHFVAKLIQDPRQIRRYFKLSAVATLIADFSTAGYKAAFEAELRNNLRARGLLISAPRKQSFAKHYTTAAIVSLILIASQIMLLIHPWPFAAGLIGMCFLSAAALRVILLILNSIPYLSEIAEVIGHIKRQSWRLQALRLIIRVITAFTYTLLLIGFLALTGIAFAILTFGFHHSHISFLALYIFLTLSFIIPTQIYVDGWKLKVEELPTATGEQMLATVRHDLSQSSPLDSFREVLSTSEYVPTFSELLAIYGIETLLILV